jgi:hypothetical protein
MMTLTLHFISLGAVERAPLRVCTCDLNFLRSLCLQQQIHAQQIPGAPPQSIPSALGPLGPLGAFAGPMGLPHGPQSLLKNPQDLHREDIKVPLAGPSAEERMVSHAKRLCGDFE